jgi:hypothetical protein
MNVKLFLVLLIVLSSCGEDSSSSSDFSNIYTVAKVYDVGNDNNAGDIRLSLEFQTSQFSKLEEVRLVIVKSSKILSKSQAKDLLPGKFFSIPLSNISKQVVKPLETLTDSDGDEIHNGSYKAYIVILGIDNSLQLTEGKAFTLADAPQYAGDYIGTWEDLGPPGPAKFPMSLKIANDYSGKMFYANANFKPFGSGAQDATTTMTVNGTALSAFNLNQFIEGYNGGCVASKTLTGNFEDDLNLVLDTFEWSDCDGTRQVKLKFTRQ